MVNAGILDGDMVLVQEEHTAENGDMVVALIEDGATVKTSIGKKESSAFSRRMIYGSNHRKRCSIIGKVIGVFRFFR